MFTPFTERQFLYKVIDTDIHNLSTNVFKRQFAKSDVGRVPGSASFIAYGVACCMVIAVSIQILGLIIPAKINCERIPSNPPVAVDAITSVETIFVPVVEPDLLKSESRTNGNLLFLQKM